MSTPPREITQRYQDPLDLVWTGCAVELGFEIARSGEVYASFDGQRRITLSTEDDFDADDSLAQMVLHELCHALVAGPDGLSCRDWALDNTSHRDLNQEYATQRLQAHLAGRWGLRSLFGVTTEWRPYWDQLPRDPLAGDFPAAQLAREGLKRAEREPWAGALRRAFMRTAEIADLVRPFAPPDSLWEKVSPRVRERHPLGQRLGPRGESCGSCAWSFAAPKGRMEERASPTDKGKLDPSSLRCEMLRVGTGHAPRVRAEMVACQYHEPELDAGSCADCGACCHRAFQSVPVRPDEPIVTLHPDLITESAGPGRSLGRFKIHRPDGFCPALETKHPPFRCRVYVDRPKNCRDFEIAGEACLEARRRVGRSVRP